MKFEAAWKEGYDNYERAYNTELQKSVKRKINKNCEFFVPSQNGLYHYALDQSIKLDKRFGSWKQGSEEFGFQNPIAHHVRDEYWDEDVSKAKYNQNPNIWFIDIETRVGQHSTGFPVPEKALEEISMFQILDTNSNTMFLLGTKEWKHQERYLKYGDNAKYEGEHEEIKLPFEVKYLNCQNEVKLIQTFLALYKKLDPLLLLAWSGLGFDYPYIHNRMKNLGMDVKQLSNYGGVKYSQHEFQGKMEFKVNTDGHFWMDLEEIYKKFDFGNHEDYKLDTIAYDELEDRKVNHDEYIGFDAFYTGDYTIPDNPSEDQTRMLVYQEAIKGNTEEMKELGHSEFVWYGLKDTWLLKRIDDKRKFTDTMLLISTMTGTQLEDTLGTVRIWSQYLSNLLYKDNLIMPKKQEHPQPHVVGGYVQDPIKGKHEWVMSVDVNSMYPLLGMVSFNMSPETYIEPHEVPSELQDVLRKYYNSQDETRIIDLSKDVKDIVTSLLQKYNIALGINGACFRREKEGIIPKTVRDIYLSRKDKQKLLKKSQSIQIKVQEILRKRGIND